MRPSSSSTSSPSSHSSSPLSLHSLLTLSPPISYSLLLLAAFPAIALGADCQFSKGGITWDLSALSGPSSVVLKEHTFPSWTNTTWSINPCGALPYDKSKKPHEQCPDKTQICGIEIIDLEDQPDLRVIHKLIPVAGLEIPNGTHADPKVTRLKNPEDKSENAKEGVSIEYTGGYYEGKQQKGIVDFICDKSKTGLEGQKKGDSQEREESKTLKFLTYDGETLKMEWRTKEACEKHDGSGGGGKDDGSHWGFFTWFFIIAFMSTAAYLIFGSWLNYNRYGARGWDLLPHGDTLRDIPYLLKDFVRKVVNTIQTGGRSSRAGYSAV